MPETVVDELEAVQVEEDHGIDVVEPASGPFDGPVETVQAQGPVGQVREGIVKGAVPEKLLAAAQAGDVLDDGGHLPGIRAVGLDQKIPVEIRQIFSKRVGTRLRPSPQGLDPEGLHAGQDSRSRRFSTSARGTP
jgi:hypothetical protein